MDHKQSAQMFVPVLIGLLLVSALLLLLSMSVEAMPATAETINPSASLTTDAIYHSSMPVSATSYYTVFLPIVLKPPGSLYGRVSENGVPAPGITVTLIFCRVYLYPPIPRYSPYCADRQLLHTTTDDNGWYEFIDMPTLVISGTSVTTQTYQISWKNEDANPNRLTRWESRILNSYSQGNRVNLSSFDIGDVKLISPISGTVAGFPVTFRWIRRASVTSDSYALCLYGGLIPPPPIPWDQIGCDQALGHIDNFTLVSPFIGIDYGYNYYWIVQVFDPSGGQGVSYGKNTIRFTNPQ